MTDSISLDNFFYNKINDKSWEIRSFANLFIHANSTFKKYLEAPAIRIKLAMEEGKL